MTDQEQVRVNLDEIRLGASCKFDIQDGNGLLLLGRGLPLTAEVREQILQRGVNFIEVAPEDARALLGQRPTAGKSVDKSRSTNRSVKARIVNRCSQPYEPARAEAFRAKLAAAASVIAELGPKLDDWTDESVRELCSIPSAMMEMMADDGDQSLAIMNAAKNDNYLASRCARMSLLGIGTAIELDFSEADIIQVGTAGLLHDLGLYRFPDHFRDPTVAFTNDEAWEYRRHSVAGAELFAQSSVISDETRLIMRQVHERPNGSGYPRGLRRKTIHPSANILCIVDAYLTLIDAGPGRPPVHPHDAMVLLLHEGGRGKFDGVAIRAFLNQVCLYPIGSYVQLSDGAVGTVVRRNPKSYSEPIIQLQGENDSFFRLEDCDLKITGSKSDATITEMRIPREMMSVISMEMMERGAA